MFLRLRWFVMGVASTLGAGALLVARMRRLRDRLAPANLARASARGVAASLERAAEAVLPRGQQNPDR